MSKSDSYRYALGWLVLLAVSMVAGLPVAHADSVVAGVTPPGGAGPQVDTSEVSPAPFPARVTVGGQAAYEVQPGDTLSEIAPRLGVTVEQLVAWNGLPDANAIVAGQVLRAGGLGATTITLPADGDLLRLQLWPWPPAQGKTVVLWLQARRPLEFGVALDDQVLSMTSNDRRAWAMVPIPALSEPGVRTLHIRAGDSTFDMPFPVTPGEFQRFDIPAAVAAPILQETRRVSDEAARMRALWGHASTADWGPRDRFQDPLDGDFARSSPYGTRRRYGGGASISAHEGEDYSAPAGTPVLAPAKGVVVLAEPLFVRGNAVLLDHGGGVFTGFWHLQKLAVEAGQTVGAGDVLGEVGSTGLSTGAHLHWELRIHGVAVDPLQWLEP